MHRLLCQLTSTTLRHLRGDQRLSRVAGRGGVSASTWKRWEEGLHLPAKPQLPRILRSLELSEDRLELTFLLAARLHLERRKYQSLDQAAAKFPEFGELVKAFETSMLLEQATLEQLEFLAGGLRLLEPSMNSRALRTEFLEDKDHGRT